MKQKQNKSIVEKLRKHKYNTKVHFDEHPSCCTVQYALVGTCSYSRVS